MSFDSLLIPAIQRGAFNRPGDRLAEGLAQHGPTGTASGRQRRLRPPTHTALPQLCREQRVHQQDEVEVARAAPRRCAA